MTKIPRITPGLILPGKLKFDQDLTKLFPEITDTLWDLHQSIKVLRSIKARLTMNTTNDNKSNPIATWTIEDTLYTLSTREKTWPSIMKAALTAVITLSIVIPQKTELVLETDIMYIKQVVDNYVNKNIQSMQIIDRHDLANHIRCILVITNSQELLQDVHVLQLQNESIPYNLKTVVKHAFQAAEYSECKIKVKNFPNKNINQRTTTPTKPTSQGASELPEPHLSQLYKKSGRRKTLAEMQSKHNQIKYYHRRSTRRKFKKEKIHESPNKEIH
ncbi:hypothetical protein C2G38_2243259 [Gigaspora rosea]|uniref:Uncharacterized protein n=1 Tax=Gigaspora rosea TaxID=44941 RepID=A0A397VMF7_9GLOM|nr:hypothetical protein C2G38_2243259 [Gigaspora rosea]